MLRHTSTHRRCRCFQALSASSFLGGVGEGAAGFAPGGLLEVLAFFSREQLGAGWGSVALGLTAVAGALFPHASL